LVAACLATREESVWAEFVRRFRPLISTVVLRTARNWGTATPAQLDDLIQETYLKLCADDCRLLKNFRSQHAGAIFGFLKVVTANVVHDHFKAFHAAKRGAGAVPASLTDPERNEYSAPNRSPYAALSVTEHAILLQEIDRCLARVVAAHELAHSRRIFWLYYRCGLSARAIAALPNIGLSTKGVESTILRLNRLVRMAVARYPVLKACMDNDSNLGDEGVHRAGSF
jgi:RNA polymerase sigma-70 factor, ECF subfamily